MNRKNSKSAYKEAVRYIPGGVNSPVRALYGLDEEPLFIDKAKGVTLVDIDGNKYTAYCLSWGVFLQGHSHPAVKTAVIKAVAHGTSYGVPCIAETELAKKINTFLPSMEKIRFVNSGTEAVMSAIRVARAYTGKNTIIKFDGCYHGHADHLLVSAGSGVAGLSGASSAGVPEDFTRHTVSIPFNDQKAVEAVFKLKGTDLAAVIVEPVPANMGVIIPNHGYLEFLRKITKDYGALLIFDEVITGFRLSSGGTQKLFCIMPDLTTLGKIIGGGFPAAAFGGRSEIMDMLAPDGPVYQAGTLSGNPVAMAAGSAVLNVLSEIGFYTELEKKCSVFYTVLLEVIKGKNIVLNHIGPMFTLFFSDKEVFDFNSSCASNAKRFAEFFRSMLKNGNYISPSRFEANFISSAHTPQDMEKFIDAVQKSI
ncbi:MAG: glutamate-1-semialdehyde 2,1-aminomutase [Rikenellaceae bacterium]|nr:glutamate-1-semialdehyde 2,1-aminomutase [Rikenellaceae bacterium]